MVSNRIGHGAKMFISGKKFTSLGNGWAVYKSNEDANEFLPKEIDGKLVVEWTLETKFFLFPLGKQSRVVNHVGSKKLDFKGKKPHVPTTAQDQGIDAHRGTMRVL